MLLFLATIFMAGKKENLFERTFTLSVIFNDVNGLKKGNYVYYSGVRSGIVKNVSFVNDSTIKVDLRMDRDFLHLIKKDARVYISTEGLVGDKILQIRPMHISRKPVSDMDTLEGINPFDMHSVMEKLIATGDHASVISENLAQLSSQLNKPHKGLVQSLTSDSSLVTEFKSILSTLRTGGAEMASLSERLNRISKGIDFNNSIAGALLHDTTMKSEFSTAVDNISKVSEYSVKIMSHLDTLMGSRSNKNAFSVITQDSAFAKDLKEGIQNFRKSTDKLDQNMEALKHNIFFRRYFRKTKTKIPQGL